MSAHLTAAKIASRTRGFAGPRSGHRGDPGILGFLGKAIGSVASIALPGIGGALVQGATALLSGNKGKPLNPSVNTASIYGARGFTAPQDPGFPKLPFPMTAPLTPLGRGNQTQSGGGGTDWNSAGQAGGTPCGAGYHYNRSGYYSQKYGFVPKGTVCVKNRKRNPLNPRALSRAMSRLSSAKNAAQSLNRISIRKGSGCGCK